MIQRKSVAFLTLMLGTAPGALMAQGADPQPAATAPAQAESTDDMSDEEIVVSGVRPRGSVIGTIEPEQRLGPADVRALGVTQTRTWNLFVDLIAQSGRFPGGRFSPGDFVVEGENRSWTSIAIDRYTGAIVDRTSENINE